MKFHKLVLGPLATNCYIVADKSTNEAVIFDTPDRGEDICNFLKENNYNLKYIIQTHSHFDHILALPFILENTDAKLMVHENDVIFLKSREHNLTHYINTILPDIKPDVILKDGDMVKLGNLEMKIIHTPGHTAGSICILFGDTLISGDTLFELEIGRIDHPTGSLEMEISSIKEKLLPLPDDTKVYPGHGPSTTIGRERRYNPYLQ